MNSGNQSVYFVNEISFKQYTTNIAIMAYGNTEPKYCITLGTDRLPLKMKKGKNLRSAVTKAITKITRNAYTV